MQRIVVGVDGSPGSRAALAFAVEEARLREVELVVVHAYRTSPRAQVRPSEEFDAGLAVPVGFARFQRPPDEAERRAAVHRREERYQRERARADASAHPARELIDTMIREVGDSGALGVIRLAIADAHPAEALIEQAGDDALLVVGSRGRGGFAGLLLGSVSQQCASHARCPVVVVPTPR